MLELSGGISFTTKGELYYWDLFGVPPHHSFIPPNPITQQTIALISVCVCVKTDSFSVFLFLSSSYHIYIYVCKKYDKRDQSKKKLKLLKLKS